MYSAIPHGKEMLNGSLLIHHKWVTARLEFGPFSGTSFSLHTQGGVNKEIRESMQSGKLKYNKLHLEQNRYLSPW